MDFDFHLFDVFIILGNGLDLDSPSWFSNGLPGLGKTKTGPGTNFPGHATLIRKEAMARRLTAASSPALYQALCSHLTRPPWPPDQPGLLVIRLSCHSASDCMPPPISRIKISNENKCRARKRRTVGPLPRSFFRQPQNSFIGFLRRLLTCSEPGSAAGASTVGEG